MNPAMRSTVWPILAGAMASAGLFWCAFREANIPPPEAGAIARREEPAALPPGPEHRELGEGGIDNYRVELRQGAYLAVAFGQLGLDLKAELFGPTGDRILGVDSPNGDRGTEVLGLVARVSGNYRLCVRPSGESDGGRYSIRTVAHRWATPEDRQRDRAFRLHSRADALRQAGASDQALSEYRQVAALWRQVNDPYGEIRALHRLGQLQALLGDPQEALTSYRRATELALEPAQRHVAAIIWNRIGMVHRNLRQPRLALAAFSQSAELFEEGGDNVRWAALLNRVASLHEQQGRSWEALRIYRTLLNVWQEQGDSAREATARTNLGELFLRLGQNDLAKSHFQQALKLRQQSGDTRGEAITLTSLGTVYRRTGRFRQARDCFERALLMQRRVNDRDKEVNTLIGLGLTELIQGDPTAARELFESTLHLSRQMGNRRAEAYALVNLGEAAEALTEPDLARRHYRHASAVFVEVGDRRGEATASYLLARVERQAGRLAPALQAIERALDLVEALRFETEVAAHKASFLALKHNYFEFAVDLLVDLHRSGAGIQGYDLQALITSERSRARSLLDDLVESLSTYRLRADTEFTAQARKLQEQLQHQDQQAAHDRSKDELYSKLRHLVAELGEIRAADRITARSQKPTAGWRPSSEIFDRIQKSLGKDTVLLEYFLSEDRSFVWLLERDSLEVFVLPPERRIEVLARQAHRLLTESHKPGLSSQLDLVLKALSRHLLAPVADRLRGHRLVVVPDGALSYVPFAALPVPNGEGEVPLVLAHEVVTLPSMAVLQILRSSRAQQSMPSRTLAVLADPVFQRSDPRFAEAPVSSAAESSTDIAQRAGLDRLPATTAEAVSILSWVEEPRRLAALGFAANHDLVNSGVLADYRILHFATHARNHAEVPELNAIYLSMFDETGEPRRGALYAHEIVDYDLPAELVVLSACRTALGRGVEGEGQLGLPQAFMLAGTARLLISLWKVDDQATAELMAYFYEGLLRDRLIPAAALRQAQSRMLTESRWRAPFYWAGFVLLGDWR